MQPQVRLEDGRDAHGPLPAAEQRFELAPAVAPRQAPDVTARNGEHVEGNEHHRPPLVPPP